MHVAHAQPPVRQALTTLLPPLASADLLALLLADEPELWGREEALVRKAQAADVPIAPLGIAPVPGEPREAVIAGKRWVLLAADEDPLWHDPDGYPVPARTLRDLRKLVRAGVEFDILFIAHELSSPASVPWREAIVPPPATVMRERSRHLGEHASRSWRRVLAPSRVLAASQRASVPSSLLGPDPVLLGAFIASGQSLNPGELARWVGIHRWNYDHQEEA